MLHLRLIAPGSSGAAVRDHLVGDDRVTAVVYLPGVACSPPGDLIHCDVTREAAGDVLEYLRDQGLYDHGSVTISKIDASPSRNADATERAAMGAPDDAIVWDEVRAGAYGDVRGSWSFYVFLSLATMIAAVAVITDSPILVVGAMVVGPEFGVIAALALGLALRDFRLSGRAIWLLARGFVVAILVTLAFALLARATGVAELADITGPRPLTAFIWRPDIWSAVVAVLAGSAGVLSQTAGKTNALVGVFISVTTVPAAGDFALSLAFGDGTNLIGSAAQLGINLVGMTVAGLLTLLAQRQLWRLAVALRAHRVSRGSTAGPDGRSWIPDETPRRP